MKKGDKVRFQSRDGKQHEGVVEEVADQSKNLCAIVRSENVFWLVHNDEKVYVISAL